MGCANRQANIPSEEVAIGPGVTLTMPSPGELNRSFEAVQLVTARYGEKTMVFESHISVTPHRFLIVSLDSLGRKAMSIDWTDGSIVYDVAPWVPEQLRPQNVLADIIVIYWPGAVVAHSLNGGRLVSGKDIRSIVTDDREIIHADYHPIRADDMWSGTLEYRNLAWGYVLNVQSIESSP